MNDVLCWVEIYGFSGFGIFFSTYVCVAQTQPNKCPDYVMTW